MKNFYFLIISILLFSCQQKENVSISTNETHQLSTPSSNTITKIKFDYYKFDAGEVEEGTVIEYEFPFTNVGDVPLVISNCKSSCGCVVPKCPREPIEPGRTGIFSAKFDTRAKQGKQTKSLTMTANTDPPNTVLRMHAYIIPKEK